MPKFRLRTRIIGWTVMAAIVAGFGFMAWDMIEEGRTTRLVVMLLAAAVVVWAAHRNAAGAKSR